MQQHSTFADQHSSAPPASTQDVVDSVRLPAEHAEGRMLGWAQQRQAMYPIANRTMSAGPSRLISTVAFSLGAVS